MLHDKKIEILDENNITTQDDNLNVINITEKSFSNLRDQYIQEKANIEKEFGTLEEIRAKLGFSRRKMCQLLLVDPSSWTRWVKGSEGAPPHIYQALKWYLQLSQQPSTQASNTDVNHHVKQIDNLKQELYSIKNALAVKDEMVNALGDRLANTISRSLTQVQVQVQTPASTHIGPSVNMDTIRETIKSEQFKNQSQINSLENTLMMLRNEIANIRNQTSQISLQHVPVSKKETKSFAIDEEDEYQSTNNKFIFGFIILSALGGIAYAFINFF